MMMKKKNEKMHLRSKVNNRRSPLRNLRIKLKNARLVGIIYVCFHQCIKNLENFLISFVLIEQRKELEERARKKKIELEEEADYSNMTPEQIQADKLRRQKLQEEADLELAKETLGPYYLDDLEVTE